MKILILVLSMMSFQTFAADSGLSSAEIKFFKQFLGVEKPACGAPGDSCRTYTDCCRGYCNGHDQCSAVDEQNTPIPNPKACAMSGQACFTNMDCCNTWCLIEKVCF